MLADRHPVRRDVAQPTRSGFAQTQHKDGEPFRSATPRHGRDERWRRGEKLSSGLSSVPANDLVDLVEDVLAQYDVGPGEEVLELLRCSRSDDGRSDGRVGLTKAVARWTENSASAANLVSAPTAFNLSRLAETFRSNPEGPKVSDGPAWDWPVQTTIHCSTDRRSAPPCRDVEGGTRPDGPRQDRVRGCSVRNR